MSLLLVDNKRDLRILLNRCIFLGTIAGYECYKEYTFIGSTEEIMNDISRFRKHTLVFSEPTLTLIDLTKQLIKMYETHIVVLYYDNREYVGIVANREGYRLLGTEDENWVPLEESKWE